ncbi:hypothetical protein E2562_037898 [Oryza meyeriana var. granulata]|uniref:Uncharacterized protein n=1 Tax=Oryza meyeriana var. granulata TaxID=110450 RepID=A0A6G1EAL3_9ORYZ|nr:hypothetical protein E2562_037898 [Oryza meyeriana var. granulata]
MPVAAAHCGAVRLRPARRRPLSSAAPRRAPVPRGRCPPAAQGAARIDACALRCRPPAAAAPAPAA